MNPNRLNAVFLQEAGDGTGSAGASGGQGAAGAGAGGAAGGDQGTGSKAFTWGDGWREALSAGDDKAAARLQRFDSPDAIWRSYRAMEQRMSSGELKSALPKDAKPEEVAKWRAENGIPETAEKYNLTFDDGLVIGDDDKPIIDDFLKAAHISNLTNDQAKSVIKWHYADVEQQLQKLETADKKAAQDTQDTLRGKWGQEYRQNMNRVHALLDTAPAGLKEQLLHGRLPDGTPIGSSPAMLEFLALMSRQINPMGTVVPGAGANIGNAIEDEIRGIEKTMRENRKTYNADEKMQARYRELLSARERLGEQGRQARALAG